DSGLARVARYDPHRGINTLLIEKISRASADQRAGRAGRTAPGRCVRLWSERSHGLRAERDLPEVRRLDLSETVLALRAAGVAEPRNFRWIEAPEPKALERAEVLLRDLGAVDADGRVTPTGLRMLKFPVHPRYARMFLAAQELGCVRAAALIAALTQSRPILLRADRRVEEERREMFGAGRSDFFLLMRAQAWAENRQFRADACRPLAIHGEAARQVHSLFHQFLEIAAAEGLDTEAQGARDEAVARCVLAGFADQVARRRSGGTLLCDIVHGRRGLLARSSIAQNSRLVVAAEINEIEGRGGEAQVILSMVTEIEEGWLREMFPADFTEESGAIFDPSQNRVVLRRRRSFRGLVLEEREREAPPSAEASACLARHVLENGLRLNGWDDACDQWLARLQFAATIEPDGALAQAASRDFRAEAIARICVGAVAYREIKDQPVLPVLRSLAGQEVCSAVERLAPERVALPGGYRAKVRYSEDGEPWIAARIQDLYGLAEGPSIGGGRHKLLIHILAPNQRPVQITKDLAGFWKNQYPELKKALERQYPKHEWR
ncbi:MAG: hypothetical protein N2322_03005, partial [Terrimicrobiaceae bacterium]|nr:hypothetical protein [Terrimicrobiaceae bacterium]